VPRQDEHQGMLREFDLVPVLPCKTIPMRE